MPKNSISLDDAAYILRISPRKMGELVKSQNLNVIYSSLGVPSINTNDFKIVAYSDDIREARIEAVKTNAKHRKLDEDTGQSLREIEEVTKKTQLYDDYIDVLINLHKKYEHKIDVLRDETALAAAYILYSNVINLLKLANLGLSHFYWDSRIMLRPIDEAVMLAEYFIISDGTDLGKKHLGKWYRENQSPSNSICREAISKHMESLLSTPKDSFKENISTLYNRKSKSIHHTLNGILETYDVTFENHDLKMRGFDYGKCTYSQKIAEMTTFFQTSIWTAFQGFFMCFHTSMPLAKEDSDLILLYNDKIFQNA